MGVSVERIRLGGGGNKSELWRQMQADVYGLRVSMLNNEEGPAFGAALLGGVGVGVWPTVRDACGATIRDVLAYEPGASGQENVRRYQAARAVYDRLYGELAPAMHALSEG
jgi:xylulokinase